MVIMPHILRLDFGPEFDSARDELVPIAKGLIAADPSGFHRAGAVIDVTNPVSAAREELNTLA
jgi:hypothetical protein